jgi:hypothetical protein
MEIFNMIARLAHSSRFVLLAILVGSTNAQANQTIRISSGETPSRQVNVEHGKLELSHAEPSWWSAQWELEPIAGTDRFYLRNRWTGVYLFAAQFELALPILNVSTDDLHGKQPDPGIKEYQWSFNQQQGADKYFVVNNASPNGQLHAETVNKTPTFFVNLQGGRAAGPDVPNTMVWTLEDYVPVHCPATKFRSESEHSYADFILPNSNVAKVISFTGGAYNHYVFPKCNRATWTDLKFTCGADGLWSYTGSWDSDAWCNDSNTSQPNLEVGNK